MLKKLIVDTNLLLLWVIGSIDSGSYLSRSNRLDKFKYEDFTKLNSLIAKYDALYITPYIATEVSNLIDLKGEAKEKALEIFKALLLNTMKIADTDIHLDIEGNTFYIYGITDNSLITLVKNYYVLTDDNPLCCALYEVNPDHVLQYSVAQYNI
ncbi:hypothetical protein NQ786_18495 [Acinetobacter baumannii]|nr:hypothetical protein [Acinetobacter baumannii]